MDATSSEVSSNSTSPTGEMSMESRVGRSKQRYNSQGQRLVAGVVPVSADRQWVLLIQSTRRKGWVLPKGGWETDELETEAAKREAWEEAGIEVEIDYDLGTFEDKRKPKDEASPEEARSLIRFFEAVVLKEHETWPESHKRERRWVTFDMAMEELKNRPELQQALQMSTLKRTL